jgi:hypothetical protein
LSHAVASGLQAVGIVWIIKAHGRCENQQVVNRRDYEFYVVR